MKPLESLLNQIDALAAAAKKGGPVEDVCLTAKEQELLRFADKHLTALVAALRVSVEANTASTHEANDHNCQDWPPGNGCRACEGDALRAKALTTITTLLEAAGKESRDV